MPYATNPNDGVRIYYEVEGSGPPVVFVHGFSTNLEWWKRDGYLAWQHLEYYVDVLTTDYQLILVDPRGYGKSDKPHDPQTYTEETKVRDTLCVLDQLSVATTHYVGYSAGAVTGWAFAAEDPDRLRSLVAIGGDPFPAFS